MLCEDVFPHNLFKVRACFLVVVNVELGMRGEGKGKEEKEEDRESHGTPREGFKRKETPLFLSWVCNWEEYLGWDKKG